MMAMARADGNAGVADRYGNAATGLIQSGRLDVSSSWNRVRVRIPSIANETHCLEIVAELYSLFQLSPPGCDWVVDVSAMKSITLSMATVLTYLGERLTEQGGRMTCTGLHADRFAGDSMCASSLLRSM